MRLLADERRKIIADSGSCSDHELDRFACLMFTAKYNGRFRGDREYDGKIDDKTLHNRLLFKKSPDG